MIYDSLRRIADSWGLVAMFVLFTIFVGWALLPRNRATNLKAARSIFEEEGHSDV
ncbi:cytochrome c oxidase cbb3-type subunit 4 [Sphingomonas vulcanisoli]|uniref:Cytochrome c oxidase cbb3-type subunit 4 n=1 Tax=Sphingomonas vulcanisoli TaxID=1658060 RepID=A0ABX0U0G7_9SPHN|nr:cbb3-type cytochrome c oxidase subunit 3 [Sphingomonas vulcanisoli]NIJ09371.1 cytochrome c oxidase cbb3-type subunit 4 [Sphingomonas vulcanisoli]